MANSFCFNHIGSYECGECLEGYHGNQTVGCKQYCNDCDQNATCAYDERLKE